MNRTLLPFSGPVVALLLSACSNNDRAEFSAEKRLPSSQRPTVFGANAEERFGMGRPESNLTAETPQGWTQVAARQFRDLNWQVAGADAECFLTLGSSGSVQLNVDRWLGQFGLESGAAKPGPAEHVLMGQRASLLQAEGSFMGKPGYALMVLLAEGQGGLTTLKMTGPRDVVQQQKDAFLKLARSIKAGTGSDRGAALPEAPGPAPGGGGAADPHAGLNMGPGAVAPGGTGDPKAEKVPADWRLVPPTGGIRKLDYRFGTGSECYIVTMTGHAGGVRPNVDRWRNETGLGPISEAEFTALVKKPVLGVQATFMEARGKFSSAMSGRNIPDALMLGAIVPLKAETLFVKMIGPAAEVEAQRAAFADFCSGLKL